jgi:O-antigen/teichoic acid export membrane protein
MDAIKPDWNKWNGEPLRDRVLRAGGWATVGFVLDKLIAAGQMVILARLLTPADFGLMGASAVVLMALLVVSETGVQTAVVSRQHVSDTDLAVAWTLAVGRALVLAVVLWVFAGAIAAFFRAPELASLLRVHALALLLQGAQSPVLTLLLRNLDLGPRTQLDLLRRVVEAVATIALAVWLRSAWALLVGQLVGFAVGCLLSYRIAPFKPRFSLDRESLRHFLHYGWHLNLTTILIFGVASGGEFVIGRMLGTEALGVYQLALAIPMMIGTRSAVVMSQVSFPSYAMLRHDQAGRARAFAIEIGVMSVVLLPLSAGLAFTASELVPFLFGPRWLRAVEPLQVLCLYAACAGLSGVMASLHYGLNRPDVQTRIWAYQFGVYATTIVPLIAWFGLVGAAGALTVSYVAGFALHFFHTARLLGPAARSSFSTLGRAALLVVTLGAVLAGIRMMPLGKASGPAFLLGGLAAVATYFSYIWRVEYPRLIRLWRGTG